MNLLSKLLLLLLLINSKIDEIKSKLHDGACACETLNVDPIKSRIFNGTDAKSDELKYIGQIYTRISLGTITDKPYEYKSICTGFLINAQYALTSGYCANIIKENKDFKDSFFFALAAPFGHNIRKARKNATYYRSIETVHIHHQFDKKSGDFNIGAIKFSEPFILGPDIQAACLEYNRWKKFSEKLYTAGYGVENITKITNDDETLYEPGFPKTLKIASGYVENCKMGKFCLKSTESGTCPQDGGSPLLYNYDGRAVVLGINDRKPDDYDKCKSNIETQFTSVSIVADFIDTQFGDKCGTPNYLHKLRRCKCKAMSTQISRGINGTIVRNKNDLTYIAHLIQIEGEKREKIEAHFGPRKVYSPVCSGLLLNKQWILTVAHCIVVLDLTNKIKQPNKVSKFDREWQVGVLKHNLKELYAESPWYNTVSPVSTIKSIHIHPDYTLNSNINDIALIESIKVFDLVALGIYPPCLLDFEKSDYGNEPLIQAGFGADNLEDVKDLLKGTEPISRRINIIIVPKDDDEYRIYAPVLNLVITKNFQVKCPSMVLLVHNELICMAGFNQSPCFGDNGGPIIAIDRERNKEYVIGVLKGLQYSQYNKTHRSSCMPKGVKYVTNIYPKMNFIKSFIGSDYCSASFD